MWHKPLYPFPCLLWSFAAPWGLACHSIVCFPIINIWWWTWLSLSCPPKLVFDIPFLEWWCLWWFLRPKPLSQLFPFHDGYTAASAHHAQWSQRPFPPHHQDSALTSFPSLCVDVAPILVVMKKKAKPLPHPMELAFSYGLMKKARSLPHPVEKILVYRLQTISLCPSDMSCMSQEPQ